MVERRLRGLVWRPHFKPFKYFESDKKSGDISDGKKKKSKGVKQSIEDFLLMMGKASYFNLKQPESKRCKSYPAYKLINEKGLIYGVYKRLKLFDFKQYLGINKTNRVVGWTPDYVGPTKSKVIKNTNYIELLIRDVFPAIKNKLSDSFITDLCNSISNHRVVYSTGYNTVYSHLKEYFKDNNTSTEYSFENLVRILSFSDFKWFPMANVSFTNGNEIFTFIRANLEAYAGHYSSMLVGQTKGEGDIVYRKVAHMIWTLMKNTPIKNNYLWSVLGREKDFKVNYGSERKVVGTRAVMTCEGPPTYLLLWFAQKISLVISNFKSGTGNLHRTFNIRGEYDSIKARELENKGKNYDWELEADWSFFDSNIDTQFLELAGLLICGGMRKNRLHYNIAFYIIKSIVTKYVVLPPGVVVELNRSQASGHPFTTLVNCYVNTIYWCLIGYKIYGSNYAEYMHIEVYGDDTRAYFKNHKNLWKIDEYVSQIGLKSDPIVDNFRRIGEPSEVNHKIDFLKRKYVSTGLVWNSKKMFDKLFYQSKKRCFDDQIRLLISYYETCPNDKDLLTLIQNIFSVIRNDKKYYSLIEDYSLKLIIDNEEWFSDVLDSNLGLKTSNHSFAVREDKMLRKYGSIYSFSSRKRNVVLNNKEMIGDFNAKSVSLMLVLGFPISDLSIRGPCIQVLFLNNEEYNNIPILDLIKAPFDNTSDDISGFFRRLRKRILIRE